MTKNDTLKSLRYTFDFSDEKMISLFALGGSTVTRQEVSQWLKRDDDPNYEVMKGVELATFLNGLIIDRRGKKDGPQPLPEKKLTNNIILRKLKIAFELKTEDLLDIMNLADLKVSSHELSAFFRKVDHKNYRDCKNQILRNFLRGLQIKHRPNTEVASDDKKEDDEKKKPVW